MTGFDRPNRSYYLDDMEVSLGDIVVCSCAGMVPDEQYTVGKEYFVHDNKQIFNDKGDLVRPSVRFKYRST